MLKINSAWVDATTEIVEMLGETVDEFETAVTVSDPYFRHALGYAMGLTFALNRILHSIETIDEPDKK